jgi:crossover junction endodeoxyribonuclease RusA
VLAVLRRIDADGLPRRGHCGSGCHWEGLVTAITVDIPRDLWLTSNGRYHRMKAATMTRDLRTLAKLAARDVPTVTGRVRIVAWISYPNRASGRADPNNAHPTTKALVDGLVDAGVLVDDDSAHVLGPDHRRDVNGSGRGYRVRLVIEPAE